MSNKRVSVLCVDDEPGILAALKRSLYDDYAVLCATSVEEGVQILTDNPDVTVVVTDHRMPGVNGFDFLTWCRTNHPKIMRIALTGYPDSALMKDALDSGLAAHVIAKPWDDDSMLQLLKTMTPLSGGLL